MKMSKEETEEMYNLLSSIMRERFDILFGASYNEELDRWEIATDEAVNSETTLQFMAGFVYGYKASRGDFNILDFWSKG